MSTQVALQYNTCLCLKSIQIQVHGQYINVSKHSCAKVNRLCFLYFSLVRVILYVSNIVSVWSTNNGRLWHEILNIVHVLGFRGAVHSGDGEHHGHGQRAPHHQLSRDRLPHCGRGLASWYVSPGYPGQSPPPGTFVFKPLRTISTLTNKIKLNGRGIVRDGSNDGREIVRDSLSWWQSYSVSLYLFYLTYALYIFSMYCSPLVEVHNVSEYAWTIVFMCTLIQHSIWFHVGVNDRLLNHWMLNFVVYIKRYIYWNIHQCWQFNWLSAQHILIGVASLSSQTSLNMRWISSGMSGR